MVEYQFVALKVVGSNPIIYPILFNFILKHRPGYYFLKKHKIRRRLFKKKKFLFLFFNFWRLFFNKKLKVIKRWDIYKNYNIFKYCNINPNLKQKNIVENKNNFILQILHKKKTAKGTLFLNKTITTLSIGSVLNYLKIFFRKKMRRSVSSLNVFINYLKKVFLKKLSLNNITNILLNIKGFDNKLFTLRKKIFSNILDNKIIDDFFIFFFLNLKLSFCKKKDKKIKSIKKRLKKKILINFLLKLNR